MRIVARLAMALGYAGALAAAVALLAPSMHYMLARTHSVHATFRSTRPQVDRVHPSAALIDLERLDLSSGDAMGQATLLVAAAMADYWPSTESRDPEVEPGFVENPAAWVLLRWSDLTNTSTPQFDALRMRERDDWRAALLLGVGHCSQQSIVLAAFLRERNIESDVIGLGGHVVATARTPTGEWVLDPNYGLVFPGTIESLAQDTERLRKTYLAAGFGAAQVDRVVEMYGPEGNGRYYTQPHEYHRGVLGSIVGISLALAVVATIVLRLCRTQQSLATHVQR